MFVDRARILLRSGEGGKGAVSFLRLKFLPFGGPNGGNGGNGGNIYVQGNSNINTLSYFKYTKTFSAENGRPGKRSNKSGKDGADLILQVPFGTEITLENQETIDILSENKVKLLRGGKGGIGNNSLATSVNQAPRYAIPPGKKEESYAFLNLKLIGDVGLVGLPNAGKSSFITSCTNSKSVVADYAFTTLEPYLGTYENLIIVDIPGIIEGASQGKGLGLKFLSHIERCKVLLMIIDIEKNPIKTYEMLLKELESHGVKKEIIIVLNKIELLKKQEVFKWENKFKEMGLDVFKISIAKKVGIQNLLDHLKNIVQK